MLRAQKMLDDGDNGDSGSDGADGDEMISFCAQNYAMHLGCRK